MESDTGRCCATCTFHVHGDPTTVLSGCGRCGFHARCVSALSVCEACRLPIGAVDASVMDVCNVGRCAVRGGVLCTGCASELAERFARHMARMGRLSAASARGWLTSFGNLRDAARPAVVRAVFRELATACGRGFLVAFLATDAVHFTERLAVLCRKNLGDARASYADIVALDPSLPAEAAGVLRRFVTETRKYWQEDPKTREVMLKMAASAPDPAGGCARELAFRVAAPGVLVGAHEEGAAELMRGMAEGTLHTLGRDIFYYVSRCPPQTAAESQDREAEWLALLGSHAGP